MRLTLGMFLIGAFNALASVGYSQDAKVTLRFNNAEIIDVLRAIENNTEFSFIYTDKLVDIDRKISLNVEEESINIVLEELFDRSNINYIVVGNSIILKSTKNRIESSANQAQRKIVIEGVVTDTNGEPLPGVNVYEKSNPQNGVITGVDGSYQIMLQGVNGTLSFSFIGFEPQEVQIGERRNINITLLEEVTDIDEVVVVGYGVQKKVNMTGAVAKIDAGELENRAVANVSQALQGLAPGLNVSLNNSGGEADAAMDIQVRGTGSLSGNGGSPLVLVDGVKSNLNDVNPNDIENISVLKDAASAAIYGADAAYGVILVTTKSGKKGEKFTVNYTNNLSWKQLTFVPDQVSSVDYAKYWNTAHTNSHGSPVFSEEDISEMQAVIDGVDNPFGIYGTMPNPKNGSQWLGIRDQQTTSRANTNWYDVIYKDYRFVQQHNVSVSGGSDKVRGYLSAGMLDDEGQLNYGNEYFKRYNFTAKLDADVTKWLNIGTNVRYSKKENSFPEYDNGTSNTSNQELYHDVLRTKPLAPYKTPGQYDENGKLIVPEQLANIPFVLANSGEKQYINDELVATFKAVAQVLSGWQIKGDYSYKKKSGVTTTHTQKATMFGPDGSPQYLYNAEANNKLTKNMEMTWYSTFNVYSEYKKKINKHNFTILAGYQEQENKVEGLKASNTGILDDNLSSLELAVGENLLVNNPISHWGTHGGFARFAYNYDGKYLFEFNGRYDGSSKFEKGKRYVFSPSASLGYNIHKEKFWQPLSSVVNTFKLRLSYGTLGNQNVAGYLYLPNIPVKDNLGWAINGSRPYYTQVPGIVSDELTWEVSKTKNIGADLTFFKNRLSTSVDIYSRRTENMFGPSEVLPSTLGTGVPKGNSATLETNGFEAIVAWRQQVSPAFSYNLSAMLSNSKSTIIDYFNETKVIGSQYEGKVLGEIWGYVADDLFQTPEEVEAYLAEHDMSALGNGWRPGNVKYLNLDEDPAINQGDNTVDNSGDRKIIGNNRPQYLYSIKGGFQYKNIDFSMFWQGVGKRDIIFSKASTTFWGWISHSQSHVSSQVMDYWSEENPGAYLPIPLDKSGKSGNGKDRYASTRYLQNGAYLRLKNLQIGYTLPKQWAEKAGIKKMRIFASGENLLTITEMWDAFDPEIAGLSGKHDRGRAYPLSRTYSLGVNLSF
ncbi:MAG: TonB-dependent receptor [Carboxylicivirga sp.]|nr:TonB-dependent receptor [Carboxylicivirga sp.]